MRQCGAHADEPLAQWNNAPWVASGNAVLCQMLPMAKTKQFHSLTGEKGQPYFSGVLLHHWQDSRKDACLNFTSKYVGKLIEGWPQAKLAIVLNLWQRHTRRITGVTKTLRSSSMAEYLQWFGGGLGACLGRDNVVVERPRATPGSLVLARQCLAQTPAGFSTQKLGFVA